MATLNLEDRHHIHLPEQLKIAETIGDRQISLIYFNFLSSLSCLSYISFVFHPFHSFHFKMSHSTVLKELFYISSCYHRLLRSLCLKIPHIFFFVYIHLNTVILYCKNKLNIAPTHQVKSKSSSSHSIILKRTP